MADKFTNNQGQPQSSGFTPQEEETAVAFGLSPSEAGLSYQSQAPTYAPIPNTYASSAWGRASTHSYLPTPTDSGQRKVVDAFVDLSNMGPDALTSLQHRLYDAGYYDASFYKPKGPNLRYGQLDEATVDAYKTLIVQSSRSAGQKTPDQLLSEGAQKGYGAQEAKQQIPKPPPLTVQLTDPNDLLAVADTTARKVLGRRLTDAELRNFVDSYHSMEAASQQAKYNAEYSQGYDEATNSYRGPGGTVTAPPSPDAYALSLLRQKNPQDAKNVEMEHGMDVFNSLLRGTG